jgi:nicotinamidase-related amidase
MSSLWSQQEISVALAEQERTCLVLCGYWLERGVTFAALNALADGFDVFVLMDVSPSYDKHSQEPAVGRLLQAGVVPLTTAQMVGEWAEEETDEARRSLLFDLLRAT